MSFELTDRAQKALSASIQLAKDYAHANLYPTHLALALLLEQDAAQQNATPAQSRPGTPAQSAPGHQSLFRSVLTKAGADPFKLEAGLRDALRKIPTQSPAPDDVSLSSAASKLLLLS